jgi:hypothetical protein
MGRAFGKYGREKRCIQGLVETPDRKGPLGRPRQRWGDSQMDLEEIGWEGIDWIHLALDRGKWWALVNMLMNLWGP